jgi:hypothetical protein
VVANQLLLNQSGDSCAGFFVLNNNITIDNIEEARGIAAYDYSGTLNIKGNTISIGEAACGPSIVIEEDPEPGYTVVYGYGINIDGCNNVVIDNGNVIKVFAQNLNGDYTSTDGIDIRNTAKVTINNNEITSAAKSDAAVWYYGDTMWAWGVYLEAVESAQVNNNTITSSMNGQVHASAGGIDVIGTWDYENEVLSSRFSSAEITGNTVNNTAQYGYSSSASGIYCYGGERLTVLDNQVTNNVACAGWGDQEGIWIEDISKTTVISGNTLDMDGSVAFGEVGIFENPTASLSNAPSRDHALQAKFSSVDMLDSGAYSEGWGIWVENCSGAAEVSSNNMDLKFCSFPLENSEVWASGIGAQSSNIVRVLDNDINLTAASPSYCGLEGIGIYDCARSEITGNILSGNACGPSDFNEEEEVVPSPSGYAEAYGIWVGDGERTIIKTNFAELIVTSNAYTWLEGITTYGINSTAIIENNELALSAISERADENYVQDSRDVPSPKHEASSHLKAAVIEKINGAGALQSEEDVYSEGHGISLLEVSGDVRVNTNSVDLETVSMVYLCTPEVEDEAIEMSASSYAEGLSAAYISPAVIEGNDLVVTAATMGEAIDESQFPGAAATGISLAIGMRLDEAGDSVINENSIQALAYGYNLSETGAGSYAEDTILNGVPARVLETVNEITRQTAQNAANTNIESNPQTNLSLSGNMAAIAGIGVLAMDSEVWKIVNNDPITGAAEGRIISLFTGAPSEVSTDLGIGVGLGAGGSPV